MGVLKNMKIELKKNQIEYIINALAVVVSNTEVRHENGRQQAKELIDLIALLEAHNDKQI